VKFRRTSLSKEDDSSVVFIVSTTTSKLSLKKKIKTNRGKRHKNLVV
jgi:hypothetical protein